MDLVLCLKVPKQEAERARRLLVAHGWLAHEYGVSQLEGDVLFPIQAQAKEQIRQLGLGSFTELFMPALTRKPQSLSQALEGKLTAGQMEQLIGSFDIVGDIAVLEIPPALAPKRQAIAQAVLQVHPQVRVVAQKTGGTAGLFRIRPVEVIAGERRTLTVSRESGCSFYVDLNSVYYTPRWSAERLRVARQVRAGENVLVCFAGVGPYAIVMAKEAQALSPPVSIVAIELNPQAALLMRKNIELNRRPNIEPIEGDVAAVLATPRFLRWADRALMPHPSASAQFLPAVLPALRAGGLLHYYAFAPHSSKTAASVSIASAFAQVKSLAQTLGYGLKLLGGRIVRPYSASLVQVVLDLQVSPLAKKSIAKKPPLKKSKTKAKPKRRANPAHSERHSRPAASKRRASARPRKRS